MQFDLYKDKQSIVGFTADQANAYNHLMDFINSDYNEDDYKRALVGPAGTGKTYLVKALIKNSNLAYSTIGVAAPTHKACRILNENIAMSSIKINTLQSDLGLRLNFDIEKFDINNPPFDPRGRIKIGDYKLYIIDEASMINSSLLIFLERTCKSKKCKIIYIGDEYQLAPVGERYSSAFKNVITYSLEEIVRQEEDNPIRPLINDVLRKDIKNKTFKFLEHISKNKESFDSDNTKGYKVCNSAEFAEKVYSNFSDPALTTNIDFAKVLSFTNASVSFWNKFIRNKIIEDSEKSIITKNDLIISYTTLVNAFNDTIIKNSEDYIIDDIVNYVHPVYNLRGFLIRFVAIHGGKVTTPLFVLDHSNMDTMRNYVALSNTMINAAKTAKANVRSTKWKEYYEFKDSCLLLTNIVDNTGKAIFSRNLDYGFALTTHKSQGSTFDTVLVDVNDIVFDKYGRVYANAEEINRRLYVACSRAKNKLYLRYGN